MKNVHLAPSTPRKCSSFGNAGDLRCQSLCFTSNLSLKTDKKKLFWKHWLDYLQIYEFESSFHRVDQKFFLETSFLIEVLSIISRIMAKVMTMAIVSLAIVMTFYLVKYKILLILIFYSNQLLTVNFAILTFPKPIIFPRPIIFSFSRSFEGGKKSWNWKELLVPFAHRSLVAKFF